MSKRWQRLVFVCIISALLVSFDVHAQDTMSTQGIEFTPLDSPAANATVSDSAATSTSNIGADTSGTQQTVRSVRKADKQPDSQSLWSIFVAGVAGGLAALLMPCIFPMLPLTVSYFTKKAEKNKGSTTGTAVLYGASIIIIYTVLGLLITALFGADFLNDLSTNGIFNFVFFLLIVAFAASFLGAFEINLPNRWVSRMDENASRRGVAGIFFMAATLALVSFSCTGPIVGTLLVQTASTGAVLAPAVGMFGFSLALSVPFMLFAMFPGWLKQLPKSGSWLSTVKVTLGFLELALALKFLSNVDLAYHWRWFDREVFLSLWIIIFGLMGLYLVGKLKLSHDDMSAVIGVPRLFTGIIVLAFTMYMIPGMIGAPLKAIAAFLPPQATQDFDLSSGVITGNSTSVNNNSSPHKYADLFDKPKGFNPYFDYDEAIAAAKQLHRPVMIDFTGHACVNCRKMEADVWTDKAVSDVINNDYVLVQLYVDDKTELAQGEQIVTPSGKHITTLGKKWSYLQISKFAANSQPYYVLLNPDTQQPIVPPQGADFNAERYLYYLNSGINTF